MNPLPYRTFTKLFPQVHLLHQPTLQLTSPMPQTALHLLPIELLVGPPYFIAWNHTCFQMLLSTTMNIPAEHQQDTIY